MRTIPEVSKRLGIHRGSLARWIQEGYLRPAVPPMGPGSVALLDERNVGQAAAITQLVRLFGDGEAAREVIKQAVAVVNPETKKLCVEMQVDLDE